MAGDAGTLPGLGLLPAETVYSQSKQVRQVRAIWDDWEAWEAYEIHMGQTRARAPVEPLLGIAMAGASRPEGMQQGRIWGTYLHGLFESGGARQTLAALAGIANYRRSEMTWRDRQRQLFGSLADFIETYLDLSPIQKYIEGD